MDKKKNHINLKGIAIKNLTINDSYVTFSCFTSTISHATLKNAAVIPLFEYLKLLHAAEKYELLADLQPLADYIIAKDCLEASYK